MTEGAVELSAHTEKKRSRNWSPKGKLWLHFKQSTFISSKISAVPHNFGKVCWWQNGLFFPLYSLSVCLQAVDLNVQMVFEWSLETVTHQKWQRENSLKRERMQDKVKLASMPVVWRTEKLLCLM